MESDRPAKIPLRSESVVERSSGALVIADEDRTVRELIRHLVSTAGFHCELVSDGPALLIELSASPPDAIIMSLSLPGLGGMELMRLVRDLIPASVPLIALIWPGNDAQLVDAFEHGADDVVAKPFSPPELLARLRRLAKPATTRSDTRSASHE